MPKAENPTKPQPWRRYAGRVAWPTVLLVAVVLLAEVGLWWSCLAEIIPLWLGGVVATLVAFVSFTPIHDASHGAVGGSRARAWLDTAVGTAMGFVMWSPFAIFRPLHVRHHGATNDPARDPDCWVAGRTAVGTVLRCMTVVPHHWASFLVRVARGEAAMRRALRSGLDEFAVQVVVLLVLVSCGLGREALALWVGPAFAASGLIAFLFGWIPHHPHEHRERYLDTRVIQVPGLSVVLLAQNYHLVHHLYPRVPFYRYGRLFRDIEDDLRGHGARIYRWPRGEPRRSPESRRP